MALSARWLEWTRDPEEKESIRELVTRNTIILGLLAKILEKDLKEAESKRLNDYENPNWPYHQADLNGYIRALKQILTLTKGN